jgi:hypothetical protein
MPRPITSATHHARAVAKRLCDAAGVDALLPSPEVAAAAGRLCMHLRLGLGRWIGADGFRTLFERTISEVPLDDRSVVGFAILRGHDCTGVAGAAEEHGAEAIAASTAALIAGIVDLLSRIVGDELAARMVEQASGTSPRAVAGTTMFGAHDG